jgi:hypothetical protein
MQSLAHNDILKICDNGLLFIITFSFWTLLIILDTFKLGACNSIVG